ncbi:replicative protein [Bivalve hepelivirus G]|uniref:replicative protein n=1 Tax=Bivalve hepelivirus G TaxID=1926998 RepID=UPI00092DBDC4|nr:replicative protein [Bivalve hepelivirus G]APJ38012.1 replicative protein [Bivalve hepelivirus G]
MSINPYYASNRSGELASMDTGYVNNAIISANSIANTKVECPIALVSSEFSWLREALRPRELVLCNNNKKYLAHRSHPLAAFMTDYATKKFVSIASNYGRSIDVGGGFDYTPAVGTHICARIISNREKSRYTNSAIRQNNDELFQTARGNLQHTVCHSGAENCTYRAPYCYSVNANYDISLNKLADIFNIHQAVVYDVAMFLPSVLNNKKINIPSPVYNVKLVPGNRVLFYFNDGSNDYSHDYDTWRSYLVVNRIKCKDFDIVSEIVDNISDFFIIRFTRVEYPCVNECLSRVFDYNKIYNKQYTAVPNIIKTLGGVVGNYNANYIICETDFVHNAVTYGMKLTKEVFAYPAFNTHCIAYSKSLIYGPDNELVYQGISNKNESFNELVLNLFIYVAIRRCDVTQTIKNAFLKINKDQKRGIINRCWVSFKTMILDSQSTFLENWFNSYKVVDDITSIEKIVSNMMNIRIVNLQHHMYENTPFCKKPFDAIKAEWKIDNKSDFDAETTYEDTINEKQVVKVPAVEHETNDKFADGQCAYRALQCSMHAIDKTALRFDVTRSELDAFKKLSYYHCNVSDESASAEIKFSTTGVIRQLDAESTWLSLEEVFLIAFINNENCLVINKKQNTVSTFRHKPGDIKMKICHDGVAHWYYSKYVGGYKTIVSTTNQLLHTNLKTMDTIYLLREKTGNHMQAKMRELFDFINTIGKDLALKDKNRVIDLTTAPGHLGTIFEKSKQGYRYYPYTINGKLKCMHKYTNEHKYYDQLNEIKFQQDDIIVIDLFIHEFSFLSDLLNVLSPYNHLIIKCDPYKVDGLIFPFNNFQYKEVFKMDNSLIQCGEIYYYLSGYSKDLIPSNRIKRIDVDEINNVNHVANRGEIINKGVDDIVAQESMIAKNFNTSVKFYVDERSYNKFITDNTLCKYPKPKDFTLFCLNGIGGSCKTQRVINVYKPGTDMIVSPIRSQSDNLMPSGMDSKHDIYTYIVLINHLHRNPTVKVRHLYIDECFAMLPSAIAYYYAMHLQGRIEHIHLMGDSKQIGPYCKDKTILEFNTNNYVTETRRLPQDITRMLKTYIPNASTTSKVASSYKKINDLASHKVDIALAFTQDAKAYLAKLGYKSMTVNESQGMTFSKVLLYLDDYCKIQTIDKTTAIRQVYVGASRHKDELLVYGKSSPELQILLTVQGAPIDDIIEEANIPLVTEPQIIAVDVKREWRGYNPNIVTTKDSVIDVLSDLNVKKNFTHSTDIRIEPLKLKKINGTEMKISEGLLHPVDVSIKGGKLTDQRFVLPYYSKDSFGTLNTQIARYATTRAKESPDHYKNLRTGLSKFVNMNKFKQLKFDNERLNKHFVDYIIELQKKILPAATDVGRIMKLPTVVTKEAGVGGVYYDETVMKEYYVLDESNEEWELIQMSNLKSLSKKISNVVNKKTVADMFAVDLTDIKSRMITFTMKKQKTRCERME